MRGGEKELSPALHKDEDEMGKIQRVFSSRIGREQHSGREMWRLNRRVAIACVLLSPPFIRRGGGEADGVVLLLI
jgi:hypothetical protein